MNNIVTYILARFITYPPGYVNRYCGPQEVVTVFEGGQESPET